MIFRNNEKSKPILSMTLFIHAIDEGKSRRYDFSEPKSYSFLERQGNIVKATIVDKEDYEHEFVSVASVRIKYKKKEKQLNQEIG